ncbi:hypothetical protein DFH06DRAFT_1139772 [Mycena polygramma]|nr:hypothetical protein DFH06DRAFT_1139772 [Mycena polygramma]
MTGPIKLPAFFELPPHQGLLGKLEMLNARQLQDISTLMPVANGLRRCGKSCDKGRFRTMQIEAKAKDHKLANRVAAQFIVEGGNKHGIQTVSGFWLHLTKEDTCKLTLVSTARLCLPARSGWMDLWHVLIVRKSAPASLRRLEVDIAERVAPIIARLRRMPTTARITGGISRWDVPDITTHSFHAPSNHTTMPVPTSSQASPSRYPLAYVEALQLCIRPAG